MASLFSKPKMPKISTPVQPTNEDPSVRKARLRALNSARTRGGRESTRLNDRDTTGSSGNKLGS